MKIAGLKDRFQFYAVNHVDIRHNPDKSSEHAFFHLEGEEVQAAVNGGIKDNSLFLQTPEAEKGGAYDSMGESMAFTYVILRRLGNQTKAEILDICKEISDDIFNLICLDFVNEVLPGSISGSNEGMVGPLDDGLYGWGVSVTLDDAYNAEVNPNKWLHLSNQGGQP